MEIEGLSELITRLNLKQTEMPKICSEALNKLGNSLKGRVVRRTPVGKSYKNHTGGTLRRSWHLQKIDDYTISVYNNTKYVGYVEFGHRTRGGKSFVEGRYMLTKSLEDMEDLFGEEFENILEKIWEK